MLTISLPSTGYLRLRACLQPTPRGMGCLEGDDLTGTRRLSSSPLIPSDTHAPCLAFAYHLFAECRLPSTTRGPSTNHLRRGMSPVSRMVAPGEVVAFGYAPPLILSPASPPPHHTAMPPYSLPLPLRSAPRLPSLTRSPLPHRLAQPVAEHVPRHQLSERLQQGPDRLHLVGQPAVVELIR